MPTNRPTDIGWVEPAKPIRGLDHLGVQAPCIALYAQLLPGITNVTDRARYYSFYPWLIRSFEHRYHDHSINEFRRVLRRAECLFALIAIRHARVSQDRDDGRHGAGMVGRLSLLRIPEDAHDINLEEYAALEGANRYFLNKLGGLGQYYFGSLRDLRVLDYASEGEDALPRYDKVRGAALADALATAVPQDAFFRLLEKGKIRWTDLDELSEFCPCALRTSMAERSLLLDLFFVKTDAYRLPEANNRLKGRLRSIAMKRMTRGIRSRCSLPSQLSLLVIRRRNKRSKERWRGPSGKVAMLPPGSRLTLHSPTASPR
jgi:hypothetical protein